jgi:uncharacterized protein
MQILTNDRIYFLLKDPHWAFIWWQVDWPTAARRALAPDVLPGPRCAALRVHDVTDIIFDGENSHSYVEIAEQIETTDHWYFNIRAAGRNYCAEVGIKEEQRWFTIARSNTLFVPPDRPSASRVQNWSTIEIT